MYAVGVSRFLSHLRFKLFYFRFSKIYLAILERVEAHETTPFRPFVGQRDCPPDVLDLMEKCWADNPDERPPFSAIRSSIRYIMKYEHYYYNA